MADAPTKIAEAITEAQSIIEAAEKRATELVRSAEEKYRASVKQGYQEGFEQGAKEASEQAVRLLEDYGAIGEQLATEAARLAISIASTVVGEHVSVNPQFVKSLALRGLQESMIGRNVIIRCNPADAKILKENIASLQRVATGATIEIDQDRDMSRGGCTIRTEFGEVDARIETLLNLVMQRITDWHDHQQNEK